MDTTKIILAIYIDQYNVYCAFFNGKSISLITPFKDSFTFESTNELLKSFDPILILVDTLIGFSPILTKHNIAKFKRVSVGKKSRFFKNLSKGENRSLEIISNYFKMADKVCIDHYKTMGYIGDYSVERVNWNSFYIDLSYKLIFENNRKMKDLFSNLNTKFGKVVMNKWLFQPLRSVDHIIQRRNLIDFAVFNIEKIGKLLKRSKGVKISKDLDIKKLKLFFRSAFQLERLFARRLKLCNKSKYIRLYNFLKLFEDRFLSSQIDDRNIDSGWIDSIASSLSSKFGIPLSIVYFPEIGFLIESNFIIENAVFKIKDKFYSKNEDMINLDNQIKDNYDEKNKKKSNLFGKIMIKIMKIKFFHVYQFIGEIDALYSIAVNNSKYESSNFDRFGVEATNRNVILGNFHGLELAELVIMNQIGCKFSNSEKEFPIYNKLGYLPENPSFNQIQNSLFQEEIIRAGNIFRESDLETLCILENPFQSTNLLDCKSIFSAFISKIQVKTLFISTNIELSCIEEIAKESNARILCVDERNSFVEMPLENIRDQRDEKVKLTDITNFLLFNNK